MIHLIYLGLFIAGVSIGILVGIKMNESTQTESKESSLKTWFDKL